MAPHPSSPASKGPAGGIVSKRLFLITASLTAFPGIGLGVRIAASASDPGLGGFGPLWNILATAIGIGVYALLGTIVGILAGRIHSSVRAGVFAGLAVGALGWLGIVFAAHL